MPEDYDGVPRVKLPLAVSDSGIRDTPEARAEIEKMARDLGYYDLEWTEEVDSHSLPLGRLWGKKP